MKKTETRAIYPLSKGLDKNSVPGSQDARSLTVAKNVVLTNRNSIRKRPALKRLSYSGSDSGLQGAIHFFGTSGGSQVSEIVRVINGRVEVLRDNQFIDLGLSVSPSDAVTFEKYGNVLILHFENTQPYYYTVGATSLTALGILPTHTTVPPGFSRFHDYRLWYGGRANAPHTLTVSAIDSPNSYTLLGGGFQLGVKSGDGDPVGLTGLSPTFRGDLFAFKWNSIYRIYRSAYGYGIAGLTDECGTVHHNTIILTQNDVFFVSSFAIHSLAMTDKYGAAEEYTVSYPVFEYFQENVNWNAAKNMIATYDKASNCVLLSHASGGSAINDKVTGFNVRTKEFFEWESYYYPVAARYFDFGRQKTMIGCDGKGLAVLDNAIHADFEDDPIDLKIKTGVIFPRENPVSTLNFTRVYLLAKPTIKSVTVSMTYWIDGNKIETIDFDTYGSGSGATIADADIPGIIGTDNIGRNKNDMVVLEHDLRGSGRSIEFEIVQEPPDEDPDQDCELYGIVYQYDYQEEQDSSTQI